LRDHPSFPTRRSSDLGYRAMFTPPIVRRAAPVLPQTLDAAYTQLLSAKADARMLALDLLSAYSRMLKDQENAQLKGKGIEIADRSEEHTSELQSLRHL